MPSARSGRCLAGDLLCLPRSARAGRRPCPPPHLRQGTGGRGGGATDRALPGSGRLETALSAFFQEASIPYSHPHHQMPMCTPANTPATPPNFPDTLTMFSCLKASESLNSSPVASVARSPPPPPPPLPQPGGFGSAWPAGSPPRPPRSPWTPPAAPSQPSGWPASVSQRASHEPKASATLEAER
nr:UBA-like domain-containing protein 1 isoform X1 [Pogona vitticeps]